MQPRSQLLSSRRGPLDIIPGTPPLLRPLVRAYLLGYASSVAPRLLTLLLQHVSRAVRKRSGASAGAQKEHESFLSSLNHTILTGFELRRFPAFCALLAGGSTLLELESLVGYSTDPWIFVCSCALIMWAWFYNPSGLPKAYQRWISSAAAVDNRLIEALRRCRSGDLRYGKDTGQAPLLQSMCEDYKWPVIWGDPAKTAPFPCEMVHMGCGPSCEYHALSRLVRSWRWSMTMYLPLNLAMQLRKPPTVRGIRTAVLSASRSSAFLGVFIMLFYYGVCLGRTRIGPHIVGKDFAGRQKIDGGVCVGCGCFMCGWSVLLETASRRKDMALFVAPRALATLFPRRYAEDKQWRETLTFAASAAVVFTCAKENPARVRGVFGKLLGSVLRV
ncbi:hypothetical protein ACHAQF_003798 [Verticillium nonalfalfae]